MSSTADRMRVGAVLGLALLGGAAAAPAGTNCGTVTQPLPLSRTYAVRGPGFQYTINGVANNPTVLLAAGMEYQFEVQTDAIHPFAISTNATSLFAPPGVINNNTNDGTVTYTPSAASAPSVSYICTVHFFCGQLQISTDLFFHDSGED